MVFYVLQYRHRKGQALESGQAGPMYKSQRQKRRYKILDKTSKNYRLKFSIFLKKNVR